jgi:hypothetical protein
MFRATSPPFIGSAGPPLLQSVIVEQATNSVRTGAFDARALLAQRTRIDAQARVVPNYVKNSPAAISATGETVVQTTVFRNAFPRRVTSLPNRDFDAMGMARDTPPTGIGLLNELSFEELLIADTGFFLTRAQKAVESRYASSDARPKFWLDNAFIDLSSITQTKPSSAWAVVPSIQSLLFSGVALSDMVFQRVAGRVAPETVASAVDIASVDEELLQISTTYPAAVDVAQTSESESRPFC